MEPKKSDRVNLEKKRGLFFEAGLLIALGFAFFAFEMQFAEKDHGRSDIVALALIPDEIMPITRREEPPPPPPEPPKVTDLLELVDNDVHIDTHVNINVEVGLLTEIFPFEFTREEPVEEDEPFIIYLVEEKPLFNGRDADVAFREWVYSVIRYPALAEQNGISGRVIAEFTIDRDGSVTDIRILRGVDPQLDAEAIRVLQMSPKWSRPGMQQGRAVRVKYQFPFVFQLQN